jgi:predicted amidophosphoribosyltransferase
MSAEVTCPVCQHRFAGPDGAAGPFACPRCGAALPRTEVRPADGNIQTTPPAPAALATTVCPACGKTVPELCLLCPHCEEPLAERHRVRRKGPGETELGLSLPPKVVWSMRIVGGAGVLVCLLVPLGVMLSGGRGVGPARSRFS